MFSQVTSEGQPIGAILARSAMEAQRAAKLVKVTYKELTPIVTIKVRSQCYLARLPHLTLSYVTDFSKLWKRRVSWDRHTRSRKATFLPPCRKRTTSSTASSSWEVKNTSTSRRTHAQCVRMARMERWKFFLQLKIRTTYRLDNLIIIATNILFLGYFIFSAALCRNVSRGQSVFLCTRSTLASSAWVAASEEKRRGFQCLLLQLRWRLTNCSGLCDACSNETKT